MKKKTLGAALAAIGAAVLVPLSLVQAGTAGAARDVDAASSGVGNGDAARNCREPGPLGGVQGSHEHFDLGLEGCMGVVEELLAGGGDGHSHAAAVEGRGTPPHEPPVLGPVDEAGHARLVQLQEARQLLDGGSPVPNDPEQPGLDDRQVVRGGDAPECPLHGKAQLGQRVYQPELPFAWKRGEDAVAVSRGHTTSVRQT